jgi:hypothetical protein
MNTDGIMVLFFIISILFVTIVLPCLWLMDCVMTRSFNSCMGII